MPALDTLRLPGPLWFASDLHLGPGTPATFDAFADFLALASSEAAALLLPGDIFDAWIGDDVIHAAPPWLARVQSMLAQTGAKIPVWLGRGNRDFLLGHDFAAAVGAHLLPDSVILESDYGGVLVSHGDQYCTDDAAYQQFRAMVRDARWQAQFLAKSIPERLALAAQARGESMAANKEKARAKATEAADIMDVNQNAVEAALRAARVPLIIHGHTHRPARHVFSVDSKKCERWVLPDWDCDHTATTPRGGWLVLDANGPALFDLVSS